MNPVKRIAIVMEHEDGSVTSLLTDGPLTEANCRTKGRPPAPVNPSPYLIFRGYDSFDLNLTANVQAREGDRRAFTVHTSLAWPWKDTA